MRYNHFFPTISNLTFKDMPCVPDTQNHRTVLFYFFYNLVYKESRRRYFSEKKNPLQLQAETPWGLLHAHPQPLPHCLSSELLGPLAHSLSRKVLCALSPALGCCFRTRPQFSICSFKVYCIFRVQLSYLKGGKKDITLYSND